MADLERRHFLQGLAAVSLGGSFALDLEAAPSEPAGPSFGFSLYGMKGVPLPEALKQCAAIGYDGVELALMPGYAADPASLNAAARRQLAEQLGERKLALLGLMENLPLLGDEATHQKNLDRIKAAAELGHDLAPKTPPPMETVLGGKPAQWEQARGMMVKRLESWARTAEAAKLVLAIKPHVGNALHTPEGAVWLMEQIKSPWLKLAYDYSHFQLQEIPLAKSVELMLPSTVFIHVKDAAGSAKKVQFLLPGEGTIDYRSYFGLLKKLGYHGPIVIEVSGQISNKPGYDPVAAARKSYANLAPLLR